MGKDLLIVDDEPGVRRVLSVTLSAAGYSVAEAASGEEALRMLGADHYDLLLLDSNLPGLSGRSVCKEVRRRALDMPIIMLTVRDGEQEKVDAFSAGADDYVTKPFGVRELTARVQALIRRSQRGSMPDDEVNCGGLTLIPSQLSVQRCGAKEIRLTPLQFKIIERLVMARGKTVPYRTLLTSVWGTNCGDRIGYLRVFIRQLRVLLEDDPANPEILVTVQHIGYRYGLSESSLPALPGKSLPSMAAMLD